MALWNWPGSARVGQISRASEVDSRNVLAQRATQHVRNADDEFVEVDDLRSEVLAAGERQQLVGQLGAERGGILCVLEEVARVIARQVRLQQLQIAADHQQQGC